MPQGELTAYEVSDTQLVNSFMEAAAAAGASNSGLVFDPAAGIRSSRMHYLKGAVLARLARQIPPFKIEEKVVLADDTQPLSAHYYGDPQLQPKTEYRVKKVWYVDGVWYIEPKGVDGRTHAPKYNASKFILVQATTPTV